MKLYADQKNDRLIYYAVIPLLMIVNVAIKLNNGGTLTSTLFPNGFIVLIVLFGIYTMRRQSRVPLFEITNNILNIRKVWRPELEVPLDSITGFERNLLFGHKLSTLSGDIVIPFGSLNKKDREILKASLIPKI